VNYDPTQGGTTFVDADGDALSYEATLTSRPLGFTVAGTNVVGSLSTVGVVTFKITAADGYGGSATDTFSIAVAAPEPGEPVLPQPSFIYDDAALSLPHPFEESRVKWHPLWDTSIPNRTTNAGATLGRVLFYDKRLSITNTHSCASCHHQEQSFASPDRFSAGVQGLPLTRNSMGLANVRYNLPNQFFSDMRVDTLERLVLLPIQDPLELGNYLPAVEEKLKGTDFYPPLFEAAFGTRDVTSHRVVWALAQFLRSILSYRTRFDQAFDLETIDPLTVLTPQEHRGFELFRDNCSVCHVGHVQTLDRPSNNGLDVVFTDPGHHDGIFRAASLRNISMTAPYMHDGRFATLREVIDHYDHGVHFSAFLAEELRTPDGTAARRLNLSDDDKNALEAFLHTLNDDALLTDPKFSDPFPP
jgi:cytochrome c peroxidase